jgi:acyl-CoA synthetase (AMP-forming)/AMP-acid ligase II
MRPELWQPFQARFGVGRILEHYGASEGNTLFVNPLAIPRTVGFTITPHRLVAWDAEAGEPVRDARGRPIRARRGEPGLLLSRVTRRYTFDGYTDAEASEGRLLRDPFGRGGTWFDSGDLLRRVGWFHSAFVDRVGDTFRWRSENVSAGQVEAVLSLSPQVLDCAVYGVQVPAMPGRAGMAAIVQEAALDPVRLLAGLRRDLAPSAVPVFLRLCDALETTGTHKHRKGGLAREGFGAEVTDPLLVLLPGADGYQPLTAALRSRIARGEQRL